MADEIDRSVAQQEVVLKHQLAHRKPTLPFCGACYNCGEKITTGAFCPGGECKEDYEVREKARQIGGK